MDLVNGENSLSKLLQAQAHVWNYTFKFINSMSLKCAVDLGIPDVIKNHGKPMTLLDLVSALQIHPSKANHVFRLMRLLVHSGFFALQKVNQFDDQEAYVLTNASSLLVKDSPFSARPFLLAMLNPILTKPYDYMTTWFETGDDPSTPFFMAQGRTIWEQAVHDPNLNDFFNKAMATDGLIVANTVISMCKRVFEGLKSLVDVGGGTGTVSKAIAKAFPEIECTVFDLPHVVADLRGSENLKYVSGDMFVSVPRGEAILLKWILHDWKDEDCLKILKKCKEAIGSKEKEGKLLIIDSVLGNQNEDSKTNIEAQLFFDIEMMVCAGGLERNEKEFSKLFYEAGFKNYKIHPILGFRSLIEVFP